MTVTDVQKDPATLTMTITSRYDAPVDAVWSLWSDPRLLERWWGPPTYPATFVEHDLRPGGRATYYMTSPEGDRHHGWWAIRSVDAPSTLSFDDGFGEAPDSPTEGMPVSVIAVAVAADGDATTMAIRTTFPSSEAMEQLLAMGMDEGMKEALSQTDDILAEIRT